MLTKMRVKVRQVSTVAISLANAELEVCRGWSFVKKSCGLGRDVSTGMACILAVGDSGPHRWCSDMGWMVQSGVGGRHD